MTSRKRPRASFPLWYLGIDTTHVLVSALFQIQNSSQYLRLGTGGGQGEKRIFYFITFLYCCIYYFTESTYSSSFLKDSVRFWNKNTLLAASAGFIKPGALARNRGMKGSDEKPGECFWGFFSWILFKKCKNVLRPQFFPEFSFLSLPFPI